MGLGYQFVEHKLAAFDFLRAAYEESPLRYQSSTYLLMKLGLSAVENGDWELAVKCLDECGRTYPDDCVRQYGLAEAYRLSSNANKAIPLYLSAIAGGIKDPSRHGAVAHAYDMIGNFHVSLIHVNQWVIEEPNNVDAWTLLIGGLLQIDEVDKAEAVLKKAEARFPCDATITSVGIVARIKSRDGTRVRLAVEKLLRQCERDDSCLFALFKVLENFDQDGYANKLIADIIDEKSKSGSSAQVDKF
jgi:tetratricopeptide (TPR) repeat protein